MSFPSHSRSTWDKAQEAEKGHWAWLWQAADSEQRKSLINNETIKGEFIFQQMADFFKVKPQKDWHKLKVLDVGCGPISLIARNKLGIIRAGVDPLRYPNWVYQEYENKNFKVYEKPFEELGVKQKFDVIVFYNALQHFADLKSVAKKCHEFLAKDGVIYLSEYLEVPTNEAHIQFLESGALNMLFSSAGFKVNSVERAVRLPGYVERPDGSPINLYIARLM